MTLSFIRTTALHINWWIALEGTQGFLERVGEATYLEGTSVRHGGAQPSSERPCWISHSCQPRSYNGICDVETSPSPILLQELLETAPPHRSLWSGHGGRQAHESRRSHFEHLPAGWLPTQRQAPLLALHSFRETEETFYP